MVRLHLVGRWPRTNCTATVLVAALLGAGRIEAGSDGADEQLWPELEVFASLGAHVRASALVSGSDDREEGTQQAALGVHVDLFLKPFGREWLRDTKDLHKRHLFTVAGGYRYYWDVDAGGTQENRFLLEASARTLPCARFVLVNRSRVELRDKGDWSWRYRNRTRLERELPLAGRPLTPYLSAEFYYDSRYDAWNKQSYCAGLDWPLGGRGAFETYYCRRHDTRSSPANVNGLGLTLRLFL